MQLPVEEHNAPAAIGTNTELNQEKRVSRFGLGFTPFAPPLSNASRGILRETKD